jgi:ATP-binding cassette subfamily F protein 3
MNDKISAAYDKHKAQNIKVTARKKDAVVDGRRLLKVDNLSLGYDGDQLFSNITFMIREGERLRLNGRNGAGKSTLVQAIVSQANSTELMSECFAGSIEVEKGIKIGLYEQEIHAKYLNLTLTDALEQILRDKELPINSEKIKQLMSDYLFNPASDGKMIVSSLSGGQKARIQLIAMLVNDPQILILDEPTNHLDLPSIEELENAMKTYHGAIIYISHDSFFAKKMGGEVIEVMKNS